MAYVQYSAAYARATARNIAANRRKGADARRQAWMAADATRNDLVSFILAKAILAKASGRSNFFTSLADAVDDYGHLTEKQEAAARRIMAEDMAGKVVGFKAPADAPKIGDMGGIYAMFEAAKGHLKHPAIVVATPVGEIKLSVAGPNARVPGSINVAEKGKFGEARYYGRITQDGVFAGREAPAELVDYLKAFAADPAKMAAEHGHKTGSCCFCNRSLTDERSTSVGYGPVCAGHYGLSWGEVQGDMAVADAA